MATRRSTLRLSISVAVLIPAPPETIWKLLTHLDTQPRWNSTVTRIEGTVAVGERLSFEIPQSPGQKFEPVVLACEEPHLFRWRINRWPFLIGDRTYRLARAGDGATEVTIDEVLRGLLLPLVLWTGPDFPRLIETMASDLRAAATGAVSALPE